MLENLKKKSALFLIFSNLIPLYGVFYQSWDTFWIVLLYWTENLIIGFFNVLRMAFVRVSKPIGNLGKLLMIPFLYSIMAHFVEYTDFSLWHYLEKILEVCSTNLPGRFSLFL